MMKSATEKAAPRPGRDRLRTARSTRGGRFPQELKLRGAVWICASLLLWGGLSGCLFDTRDPDDPDAVEVPREPPTEPRIVLENIRKTFSAKQVGNYNLSLADDFAFEPDRTDANDIPGTFFVGWNKERETSAMGQILNSAGTITFTWTPSGEPLTVPDRPNDLYYENLAYRMTFRKTTPEPADTTLSGKANLYMRDVGGAWFIYKWVDIRDGATSNATLGMARYRGRVEY